VAATAPNSLSGGALQWWGWIKSQKGVEREAAGSLFDRLSCGGAWRRVWSLGGIL
jgi:hypothetical protein